MGKCQRFCPACGRKMKQQFIELKHCSCGVSWKKDIGYFERTPDMIFSLEHQIINGKRKTFPHISYQSHEKE